MKFIDTNKAHIKHDHAKIKELREMGYKAREVSQILGISLRTIESIFKKMDLQKYYNDKITSLSSGGTS